LWIDAVELLRQQHAWRIDLSQWLFIPFICELATVLRVEAKSSFLLVMQPL
jgi:hypothetical protein